VSSTREMEITPARTATAAAEPYVPGRPGLVALAIFVLAALTLCWPMLTGKFLLGDDQLIAGYGFRHFASESIKASGTVPQWNPYLFGGLPFIGAMHGDLFYPISFVLRWAFSLQTAMNLVLALHFVIAGLAMYAFLRALRTNWIGAVVGGVAYELSGILASMVNPGHDGKLYVSALAPLAFLGLLRAIRNGRPCGYGLLAMVVAFGMFSHYQMTYYLLVASAVWTLWLVFLDPERRADLRWPLVLGAAFSAVLLGLVASAVQALPFFQYIPHSPRSLGGPSGGWAYATAFAMPVEELMTMILPQFNGVLEHYWGQNFFKLHTEYLGASVVLLAALGIGDRSRGRLRWALLAIGGLFLLVAWGGHTPFYRLWYEVMPMMKKVRAAGMAFFIPALVTCVFAGFGADRLMRGAVSRKALTIGIGVLGGIALLGVTGILQSVAEVLAKPETAQRVVENAPELRLGSLRLLVVILAMGGVSFGIAMGRLRGAAAAAALVLVVVGDLRSVDRIFFTFKEPASKLFADDAVTTTLKRTTQPYRAWDPAGVYLGGGVQGGSVLMAYDIPQVLGYHGNELRYYDELLGGKGQWTQLVASVTTSNPALPDLVALRYVILPSEQPIPGFHKILGPVTAVTGNPAVLYERDAVPPYARVVSVAAKVPDAQLSPTIQDPRFPYDRVALYPDSVSLQPAKIDSAALATEGFPVTSVTWAPGRIRLSIPAPAGQGQATVPRYLLVSENWYPDWHATIDGAPAKVLRGDQTFLSVVLPPGPNAHDVVFEFASASYRLGKILTGLAALLILGLLATGFRRGRVSEGSTA
jgi:hypothetical protein